jgi:hypothetical protein
MKDSKSAVPRDVPHFVEKLEESAMPFNWEDLKKTVKDGLSTAAAKTEEYTKLGKGKLDLMSLNKGLNNAFQELGVEVFTQLTEGGKGSVPQNPKVKELIERILQAKKAVADKEKEIEAIRKGPAPAASKPEDEAESSGPDPS